MPGLIGDFYPLRTQGIPSVPQIQVGSGARQGGTDIGAMLSVLLAHPCRGVLPALEKKPDGVQAA